MAFLTLEDVYGSIECVVFSKKYEIWSENLVEDNIVLLYGTVSLQKDVMPKLLLEKIIPVDEIPPEEFILMDYVMPETDYEVLESEASRYEDSEQDDDDAPTPAPVMPSATVTPSAQPASPIRQDPPSVTPQSSQPQSAADSSRKSAHKGIYLRVPSADSIQCERAKKMCCIFNGSLPLVLYYNDTKIKDYNTGIVTASDPALIKGLIRLLGEQNVVVRT